MNEYQKTKIDEEFEKICPQTIRPTLFDNYEYYTNLRNYVMAQPHYTYDKTKLPFCRVILCSYVEYKRQEVLNKEMIRNNVVFFLKQSRKDRVGYCNAIGYYIKQSQEFVLLPYSIIDNNYNRLKNRECGHEGQHYYTLHPMTFNSPEEATRYVLGENASIEKWIDVKGQKITDFYPELMERVHLEDYSSNKKSKGEYIYDLFDNLLVRKRKVVDSKD